MPTPPNILPGALQNAGYRTALIGKMHSQGRWGDDLTEQKFVKEAQGRGFDHVFEVCGKSFSYWDDCNWTHHLRDRGLLDKYQEPACGADLRPRVAPRAGVEPATDGLEGRLFEATHQFCWCFVVVLVYWMGCSVA